MDKVLHVRGRRQELLTILRRLPGIAAGNIQEAQEGARGLLIRMGMTAFSLIREAFIVKSRGGTDDCGLKWAPLDPKTVAYSRRHPGVLFPGSARAPFAPSWMLTEKQRKEWWALYRGLGGTRPTGRAYHATANREIPGHAAAAKRAWIIMKSRGAKTLIGTYGNAPHEILNNTGHLLATLSPGEAVSGGIPSVPDQVFRTGKGEVIVGTNREWAGKAHQKRPLWPPPSMWNSRWWGEITEQAREGLIDIALSLLAA